MMTTLCIKNISEVLWSLLLNIGGREASFLATIILASISIPKKFGLIGVMMAIFLCTSRSMVIACFRKAFAWKRSIDSDGFSSIFWRNLAVKFLVYMVLFFTARFLFSVFHQPALIQIAFVLALLFVTDVFFNVQQEYLRRQVWFRALVVIYLLAEFVNNRIPGDATLHFLKQK